MGDKKIYRYNDDISFRLCSLAEGEQKSRGDCTTCDVKERNWQTYYSCRSNGLHFHCTKHPEMELTLDDNGLRNYRFYCPKCNKHIDLPRDNIELLEDDCLKLYNSQVFKDAKLIRLDDYYIHEVTKKVDLKSSEYFVTCSVKKDKDGDTVVILYIGLKGSKEKAQYFIKPEKKNVSHDHNDSDPFQYISKIEVTLNDRTIIEEK